MNRLVFVLVFVLLLCVSPVVARNLVTLTSGDLPYSASSNDSIQIDGNHITSNGTAINVESVNNVYFDFGTDTLEYGANGGNNEYGLRFQNAYNCTVNGGTIMRAVGPASTDGESNHTIYMHGTCYGLTFNDVDLITDGYNGHCVLGYGPHYSINFDGGTWRSDSRSFSDRHNYTGAVAWLGTPGSGGDYAYWIHGVSIVDGPAQGIITISGRTIIDSCDISTDHINTGPTGSDGNQYLILLTGCTNPTSVTNCTLVSGSDRGGSRGVLIENSNGTADERIVVRNNYFDIHNGPDSEGGMGVYGSCRIIRLRTLHSGSQRWSSYIDIRKNTVYGTSDFNESTTHIGREVIGIDCNMASQGLGGAHHIRVDSNKVYMRTLGTNVYNKAAALYSYVNPDTTGMSCSYNEFYGSDVVVRLADGGEDGNSGNGIGCTEFFMHNNILGFLDTTGNDSLTYDTGYTTWSVAVGNGDATPIAVDNVSRDATYLNGASDTDILFRVAPGPTDIAMQKTVGVYVKDSDADPIVGATVRLIDDGGSVVWSNITDVNGYVAEAATYLYDSVGTSVDSNYNPFTLRAIYGTDSTDVSRIVACNNGDTTVVLDIEGEPNIVPVNISGKVVIKGKKK